MSIWCPEHQDWEFEDQRIKCLEAEIGKLEAELAEEKEFRQAEFLGYHLAIGVIEEQCKARIAELEKQLNERYPVLPDPF